MEDFLNAIENAWNQLVFNLMHMSLGMALWIGLGVLMVGLLILISTRWGHAKPVWKCVALSLLAHLLLGGFAYGTKLIMTVPTVAQGDPIILKVVESEPVSKGIPEEATAKEPATEVLQPWDRIDDATEAQVDVEPVKRVPIEFESKIPPMPERPARDTAAWEEQEMSEPQEFRQEVPLKPAAPTISQTPTPLELEQSDTKIQAVEPKEIQVVRQKKAEPEFSPAIPSPTSPKRMDVMAASENVSEPPTSVETSAAIPDLPAEDPDWLVQMASVATNVEPGPMDETSDGMTGIPTIASDDTELRWGQRHLPTAHPVSKRLGDGQPMPDLYAKRDDRNREQAAIQYGGSRQTEQAVASALEWLSQNQEPDGRWSAARFGAGQEHYVLGEDRKGAGAQADTGITGLALLAFLATGQSHLEGEHRVVVQKGLEFLLNSQRHDGCLAGNAELFAQMYCHAMATLAVCEAIALTGDPRLQTAAEAAVNYSVRAQNPEDGGWRYRPGGYGDMSQFGWQVMALKSAELGGIEVPSETKERMKHFLAQCSSGSEGGLASYRVKGSPTVTMTAESLLCRYFLLEQVDDRTANEAAEWLLQHRPGSDEINYYYWYYATLALFHRGGNAWETWNADLTRQLVDSQVKTGAMAGSWEPNGVWCGYGGRIYSTAMATLCLEVYYRYSRPE